MTATSLPHAGTCPRPVAGEPGPSGEVFEVAAPELVLLHAWRAITAHSVGRPDGVHPGMSHALALVVITTATPPDQLIAHAARMGLRPAPAEQETEQ